MGLSSSNKKGRFGYWPQVAGGTPLVLGLVGQPVLKALALILQTNEVYKPNRVMGTHVGRV
jgi:hypothetical protein